MMIKMFAISCAPVLSYWLSWALRQKIILWYKAFQKLLAEEHGLIAR